MDASEEIIVQQCCCTAVRPHGLSETLAVAFPHGNAYAKRRPIRARVNCATPEDRSEPGTIDILGDGITKRKIACLYGQYAMGKPGKYHSDHGVSDSATDRLAFFASGLQHLAEAAPASVAFPFKIGCGLAGGNWKLYEAMLTTFAENNPGITVAIYTLPPSD